MKLPHRRRFLHLAAGAAALPAVSRFARAQAYPSRPVRSDNHCPTSRAVMSVAPAAAEVGKPRLHLGVGDAGIDLLVELVDNLDRRVALCADAKPAASLVARYEFGDGRDVRQCI